LELVDSSSKGSNFSFTIPFKFVDGWQHNDNLNLKPKAFEKQEYLIVSKSQLELGALAETLESEGGSVRWIRDHLQLERLVEEKPSSFAAIFFDPNDWLSSTDTIKSLKAWQPMYCKLVVLTLPQEKHCIEKHTKAGADAWLVRPIRKVSLLSILGGKIDASEAEAKDQVVNVQLLQAPPMVSPIKGLGMSAKRVLLAEDNDINALLVSAALKKHGISVHRAVDGNSAIADFKSAFTSDFEANFDLVLMDMHMPHCDGYSATAAIRKFETDNDVKGKFQTPIFALTADEQNESKERAWQAGVNGFLVKPIDPVKLCELVEFELEKSTKRDKVSA
jgi:CheY-like chemotaxis protein